MPIGAGFPTLRFSASPNQELDLPRASHKARDGWGQAGPRSMSTTITLISPTDLASMLPINFNIKIKVFLFQSSSHAALLQASISASLKELLNSSSWDLQKQQLSSVANPLSSPPASFQHAESTSSSSASFSTRFLTSIIVMKSQGQE